MKACPKCGTACPGDATFCIHCGVTLGAVAQADTLMEAPQNAQPAGPGPAQGHQAEPGPGVPATRPDAPPGVDLLPGDTGRRAEQAGQQFVEAVHLEVGTGTVIDGKYTIESVLGEGGMGVVYLARERHTGIQVVLKAVRSDIAHRREVRERTLAEGRALAHIDHPNVVQLKAVVVEDQELWLVMQYIEGESLEDAVGRSMRLGSPIPPAEVLHIFRQIIAGVAAAHREGLIHRDLKPANILIRAKDGCIKVTDFGIAKVEEDAVAGRGKTVGFLGSPAYTSPEQVRGQKDLDRRVDIYALGILLYEMLMGETPFEGQTVFETLGMHLKNPIPRVSEKRDIPPALDDIIQKACSKDREERYGDCDELLAAIDAVTAPPLPAVAEPAPAPAPVAAEPAQASLVEPPKSKLGTLTSQAAALPVDEPKGGAGWKVTVVVVVGLVVGAGVAIGSGAIELPWAGPAASATTTGATAATATATATASATVTATASATDSASARSPLAALEGRWRSVESGSVLEAVPSFEALEFRVVRPEQFRPQDYRADEVRFVLHPLPGQSRTFAVEDRIRPKPPAGYSFESAQARTTCKAVWREAAGKPLRAHLEGERLSVDFAKIEPTNENFDVLEPSRTVLGCRGLEKLPAQRLPVVLERSSDRGRP